MKQLMIAVAGIGFVIAFSPTASAATNILVNPGFETGSLSPWFQSNDSGGPVDWTISTTDPHSGTYDAMDDGNKELLQDFADVPGSDIADISFWVRHPNSSTAGSFVEVLYKDGSSSFEVVHTSDTGWDFFDVTGLVDPTKTVVGIGIFGYCRSGCPGGDVTFLDDLTVLSVGGVPEPSTWAMLLIGFAGLGYAAYRKSRVAV